MSSDAQTRSNENEGEPCGPAGGLGAPAAAMPGEDVVRIDRVRAMGTHGVLTAEHTAPQPFEVDIAMLLDVTDAARTDDLAHTVSYAEVAQVATAIVEGPHVDLVETLAVRIADAVLTRYPWHIEQVQVTVHKPEAPVGLPFGDVAVSVTRRDERPAVIALGANLAAPARTLALALTALRALPRTQVTAVSPLVETDPVGGPDQPMFLNAVTVVHTSLRPTTLLRALHAIEARHGRVREVRWGARTLDLDLVQYGDPQQRTDLRSDDPALTLPHPRAQERGFVLAPWVMADPASALRLGDGDVRHVAELLRGLGEGHDPAGRSVSERPGRGEAPLLPEGVRTGPDWPVLP